MRNAKIMLSNVQT